MADPSEVPRVSAEDCHQAIDAFRFGDLPPELRKEIFQHMLVVPEGIHIGQEEDQEATSAAWEETKQAWSLSPRKAFRFTTVYADKIRPLTHKTGPNEERSFNAIISPAILRVSKAIYGDALPVLYGLNKFAARESSLLARFLARLGKGQSHLGDIELEHFPVKTWCHHRDLEASLRCMPKLRKLVINVSRWPPQPFPEVLLARQMMSLLSAPGAAQQHEIACGYDMTTVCTCISLENRIKRADTLLLRSKEKSGLVPECVTDNERYTLRDKNPGNVGIRDSCVS